jgi:hypothetical protein
MRAEIFFCAITLVTAVAAHADAPAASEPRRDCFRMQEWRGWRASGNQAMNFRVGLHDVFRIDLNFSESFLNSPNMHLISQVRGGDSVCDPVDLDLKIADDHGMAEPLFIKSIRKLSPEEIAAIPDKERP